MGMMERGNRELELVGELQSVSLPHYWTMRQTMDIPSRTRPSLQLHSNAFEPEERFGH